MSVRFLLFTLGLAAACGPSDPPAVDGGSCSLSVVPGTGGVDDFRPLVDGDPAELILGFQGVRMLSFALAIDGVSASEAEISAFITIEDSALELSQRSRERGLIDTAEGFFLDEWLVFFNDTPAASLVGTYAEIEVIVRAEGCVGGTRMRVEIRDDDGCVDHTIVLDAGVSDASLPDASVCEGES